MTQSLDHPAGDGLRPFSRKPPRVFFFGDREPLFGSYHAPLARADHATGVVVCNPFGRESLYAHRTLRTLALGLAERGFHVLRFDYFGTGDSAGEGCEASLTRWRGDVGAAVEELERRSGTAQVALVGLRLGASLAWLAAADRPPVEALILWEPVRRGRDYLEEVMAEDSAWREERHLPLETPAGAAVLGFELPDTLRHELETLDLGASGGRPPARRTVVVQREDARSPAPGAGGREELLEVPAGSFWQRGSGDPTLVVPRAAIGKVVEWADGAVP